MAFGVVPCLEQCTACVFLNELHAIRQTTQGALPAYIYFIQTVPTYAIKVGLTGNLNARTRDLTTASPFALRLRARLKLGRVQRSEAHRIERTIHTYLTPCHLRGEWFTQASLIRNLIDHVEHPRTASRWSEKRRRGVLFPPIHHITEGQYRFRGDWPASCARPVREAPPYYTLFSQQNDPFARMPPIPRIEHEKAANLLGEILFSGV